MLFFFLFCYWFRPFWTFYKKKCICSRIDFYPHNGFSPPSDFIILWKLLTSVASVRLFIALHEKIHFCKGKTMELYSLVWLSPINALNMHRVQLYCLLCTVPQPTVQLHILYKIIIARVSSPCRFRTLMGPSHTIKKKLHSFPLVKVNLFI